MFLFTVTPLEASRGTRGEVGWVDPICTFNCSFKKEISFREFIWRCHFSSDDFSWEGGSTHTQNSYKYFKDL